MSLRFSLSFNRTGHLIFSEEEEEEEELDDDDDDVIEPHPPSQLNTLINKGFQVCVHAGTCNYFQRLKFCHFWNNNFTIIPGMFSNIYRTCLLRIFFLIFQYVYFIIAC